MRTLFAKCASWKTPEIPSKMRTRFQDAHEKLRTFEWSRAGSGVPAGSPALSRTRQRRAEDES
jgi:hypothetical protein